LLLRFEAGAHFDFIDAGLERGLQHADPAIPQIELAVDHKNLGRRVGTTNLEIQAWHWIRS
jgi:hypothetical protein